MVALNPGSDYRPLNVNLVDAVLLSVRVHPCLVRDAGYLGMKLLGPHRPLSLS